MVRQDGLEDWTNYLLPPTLVVRKLEHTTHWRLEGAGGTRELQETKHMLKTERAQWCESKEKENGALGQKGLRTSPEGPLHEV